MEAVWAFLQGNLVDLAGYLANANQRIFGLYLASAVLLALWPYWRARRAIGAGQGAALAGFLRFLLPARVYTHPSVRHDLGLWIGNKLIRAGLLAPLVFTMVPVALGTTEVLESLFGQRQPLAWSATSVMVLFTLALFLADDLTRYLLHLAMHKVPLLWEFHKVHHSAPVLTPLTIYRSHPVESFLYACRMALTQGLVVGVGYYLFGPVLSMQDILGANVGVFLFNIMGANLRHSHVWLSWGDRIEGWFISPAQHQVHHSNHPAHFDTNLGSALAIWDRLGGSLIKASAAGDVSFGCGGHGHHNLLALYGEPFVRAYRLLRRGRANSRAIK